MKNKLKYNFIVTGSCGFIGFHLTLKICELFSHSQIFGLDNLNDYYDISLKKNRLKILKKNKNFFFIKEDINNINKITFPNKNKKTILIHLAAQAGVRYSFTNPRSYIDSNLSGFYEILEFAKKNKIFHLLTASTSSVYGNQKKFPLKESDNTNLPITLYAATKKSNEVMAHSYSSMYQIPITILRLFTVYGSYGRPDMALYKFVKNILLKKPINLFNKGNHSRDFTYIDDVVAYILGIIFNPPKSKIPYEIFNVCGSNPKSLKEFVKLIENKINIKSNKKYLKFQKGDVLKTFGSNLKINKKVKNIKHTSLDKGISKFVDWFKDYS